MESAFSSKAPSHFDGSSSQLEQGTGTGDDFQEDSDDHDHDYDDDDDDNLLFPQFQPAPSRSRSRPSIPGWHWRPLAAAGEKCATLHGGDNHFALPAQETAKNSLDLKDRMALNLKNQNVFLRIERNFYHHMTLQQKPTDFDVLVQIYEKRCAESIDGQEEIAPLGEARLCNLKDASATDLTQKATLWTLQEIKIDPLDDSDAGDLLLQMAEAKAWGFELFMMMLHCGWEVQDLDRNDFFSKGGEKEFTILTPGAGSFHRSYLQVLLQSDWLFEAGISSIFHCQSKAYYDCILSLAKMGAAAAENLKNLKPHRPAAEYKQMVKMQQEPGGKANRSKGTDLLQEEE
eukprot:s1520_g2.t1